ncbi:MAG: hypothetical protein IKH46_00010 [Lachnospiraceae bacterium]|nr:hypothetical protein [Lachnospiraceae bacterium]
MYNQIVKEKISELLDGMIPELENMIDNESSTKAITRKVMDYFSSKVVGASRGYISSIYTNMSQETLKEEVFQDVKNANKFYALDLDKKLIDAYRLDITTLDSYKNGITVKEINKIYATAAATAGGVGVGGILLGTISGAINIPLAVIIGGAVACGLASGLTTYYSVIPRVSKKHYKEALYAFVQDFKKELYKWVDSVEEYYNSEVEKLKNSL